VLGVASAVLLALLILLARQALARSQATDMLPSQPSAAP